MSRELKLADGRSLSYDTFGDPGGTPVIFNHGFSGSHVIRNPDDALTASLGVHWIAADQPGVGGSSPKPGRKIAEWGADMEQLADHLKLEAFNVAGHSGGGPHALSIAFHLPERVHRVALASPVAPFEEPGVTDMLVTRDLQQIVKIRHHHRLMRWAISMDAKKIEKDIPSYLTTAAAEAVPHDAPTFHRNLEQEAMFEESFRLGYIQDEEGVYEMLLALWHWGFKPKDIKQPVDVFYGTADDIVSPHMPLYLCDELPNATSHRWDGAGHYGFIDREHWIAFLTAAKG